MATDLKTDLLWAKYGEWTLLLGLQKAYKWTWIFNLGVFPLHLPSFLAIFGSCASSSPGDSVTGTSRALHVLLAWWATPEGTWVGLDEKEVPWMIMCGWMNPMDGCRLHGYRFAKHCHRCTRIMWKAKGAWDLPWRNFDFSELTSGIFYYLGFLFCHAPPPLGFS
jgi:hypothetical protein